MDVNIKTPSNNYDASAPNDDANSSLLEVLMRLLRQESRNIHTVIPAKVTEVDYTTCSVTAQPLIKTMIDPLSKKEVSVKPVADIPIIFTSAKRGAARISVPVSVGDVGLIAYCERETENFLTSDGVSQQKAGVYEGVGFTGNLPQIGFIPEVFSFSAARKFLKDTLVVEFSKAISWWKANGQMTHKNDNCSLVLESTGAKTFTNNVAIDTITATGAHTFTNANSTTTVLEDGSLSFTNQGCTITATSAGAVTVAATGAVGVTAGGAVNINATGAVALVGGAGATITSGSVAMAATTAGTYTVEAPTSLVFTVGDSVITQTTDSIVLTAGGSSITINASGVTLTGPSESSSVN